MRIVENINGNQKVTSYGEKLFYRDTPNGAFTQLKKAYYRESPSGTYTQFYQYDNTPPVIYFTSSNADTINASYILTGNVSDAHSGVASVTINNVPISLSNGNFAAAYTLGNGVNYFTVRAWDIAGNYAENTLAVNYVNQKNDPNYNWGYTGKEPPNSNSYNYVVYIGGVAYAYRNHANASGTGMVPSYGGINSTIPLPKGISSLSGSISGWGDVDQGRNKSYSGTLVLHDNTTNQDLASVSFKGGGSRPGGESGGAVNEWGTSNASYSWSISAEQSKHDLVLIITGSAYGDSQSYSNCETGMSGIPTFTWY